VRNPVSVIRNSIFLIALTFTGCSTEAAVCPFHLSRRSCWWQAGSWTCFRISSSCRRDLENNKRQQRFRSSCCQGLLNAIFLCKYKPSGFICKYTSHLVYQVMVATVRCEEIAGEKLNAFDGKALACIFHPFQFLTSLVVVKFVDIWSFLLLFFLRGCFCIYMFLILINSNVPICYVGGTRCLWYHADAFAFEHSQ